MLGDIGVTIFIIRDKNGAGTEIRKYSVDDAGRARRPQRRAFCSYALRSSPVLLYHTPGIGRAVARVSLFFLICGFESMSFPIAIRRKRSRIIMCIGNWRQLF